MRIRFATPFGILSLLLSGACTTWGRRPVAAPGPDAFLAGPVRVTRTDESPILLDDVTIGRDSLVGRERAAPRSRVAISLSDRPVADSRSMSPGGPAAR